MNTGCPVLRHENQVGVQRKYAVPACTNVAVLSHRPSILVGMRLRYRYRLDPDPAQRRALAKAFGCARVVFNDGLRAREDADKAGRPYLSDGELSRRLTVAKGTPERAWLGEVSAVALQQSLADLHRAYRNYFRALAEAKAARARGEQARLKVRKPRFKSRHHDQAVRFTANSRFRVLPDGRLSLPKIGNLKVRWSRPLPADPSSVTVTLDGAGRYHASFVVEVREVPLPAVDAAVGVDLGLTSFAALHRGEGRQPALAAAAGAGAAPLPAQHGPQAARQQEPGEGPSQGRPAARPGGRRPPGLPPSALHPPGPRAPDGVRGTLNVAGMGRSKLAKSVHDAGWGQFTAMLEYKAALYGRQVVKVDPWYPSSQVCSACGHRAGPKPLKVRSWTCPGCGVAHDRDLNASKNILGAGLALAACGVGVRPGATPAVDAEAGTALAGAA